MGDSTQSRRARGGVDAVSSPRFQWLESSRAGSGAGFFIL